MADPFANWVGLTSDKSAIDSKTLRDMGTDVIAPTTGQVLGATAGEAAAAWPVPRLFEQSVLGAEETGQIIDPETLQIIQFPPAPLLSGDTANEKYGIPGILNFKLPISEARARSLNEQKRAAAERQDILNRNEGGLLSGAAARFATNLAVSALDPLNIASAFVPIVGEARYSALLAQAGRSTLGRAAVRAGVGAVEGGVGAAAMQPLEFALSRAEQNDYTMADALANIAFGSAFGGGLHAGGGFIRDRFGRERLRNPMAQRMEDADPEVRDAVIKASVAAVAEGREVNVAALLDHAEAAKAEADALKAARREFTTEPDHEAPGRFVAKDEAGRVVATGDSPEQAIELARQSAAPTPDGAPPVGAPTPTRVAETITSDDFRAQIAAAGGDMGVASDRLAQQVGQALAEGKAVTLHVEGKAVPITSVTGGRMRDAQGNQWGTASLAQPLPVHRASTRIEITDGAAVPRIDSLTQVRVAAEARLRAAQEIVDAARTKPGTIDPADLREAQRIVEKMPENVDDAAIQKMAADTEAELQALRRPGAEGEAEFPPAVQRALDESAELAKIEEGYAAALEEAGACLAEGLVR